MSVTSIFWQVACYIGYGMYRLLLGGTDCQCCLGLRLLILISVFTLAGFIGVYVLAGLFVCFILSAVIVEFVMRRIEAEE